MVELMWAAGVEGGNVSPSEEHCGGQPGRRTAPLSPCQEIQRLALSEETQMQGAPGWGQMGLPKSDKVLVALSEPSWD